MLRDNQINKF